MDPRQRQRLGWIVRFFALLLVLTLLARGTAGAAMASVTVQRPSSGNVTKSVRTTATVSFAGGTPFTVPAGLLVMAVPVQAGQTVKAGDTLAVFDAAEVDRAVNAKRAALQQARTQAAQQTAGDTADPYAAQLAQQQLERAYEETHRIYADGEESVSRAQTKRDEAAAALEKARNAGYADDAEKQAAVENAAAALEAAEDALYSAQKAAEDANNAALSAAQSAEDNRNTALHTLEKEQETTEKQNALDRAAAAVTASDAETLQAELDALLAVQQAGGTLTAPSDGTLVSLDLVVGQPSPAVGGQLAADADFTAEIPLEESQANLVSCLSLPINQGSFLLLRHQYLSDAPNPIVVHRLSVSLPFLLEDSLVQLSGHRRKTPCHLPESSSLLCRESATCHLHQSLRQEVVSLILRA